MKEKQLEPAKYAAGEYAAITGEMECAKYVKQLYAKAAARGCP